MSGAGAVGRLPIVSIPYSAPWEIATPKARRSPLWSLNELFPKTEATGRLRQMEADVVAVLLEVVFGGALLVAPSRPDGGTHRQEAAFGIFGAPAHLPAHGRFRQLSPGRAAAGCLTAPAQPFSLIFSLIYPHRRIRIS